MSWTEPIRPSRRGDLLFGLESSRHMLPEETVGGRGGLTSAEGQNPRCASSRYQALRNDVAHGSELA